MEAAEIVCAIETAGGQLWATGETLAYRLPESALSLVPEMKTRKRELLNLLQQRPATRVHTPPIASENIIPAHHPSGWAQDFHTWANLHCVFRDRCFGAIGCLHVHFCERTSTRVEHCARETFEALLRDQGFEIADGLIYGLILKEDARLCGKGEC
jgi:hypothetical protein